MGKYEVASVIERIEEIRTERKISQLLLCSMTGISRSNFYYIIKKKVSPTLETLDRLADAMGVDMAEFFKPSKRYTELVEISDRAREEYFSKNYPHWNDMKFLSGLGVVAEDGPAYTKSGGKSEKPDDGARKP